MAKNKEKNAGYGKLLDAWRPPPEAGAATGCLATSFTFSPVLFEEECLSRFLKLETDPLEDCACYIIEREEKLSQVRCAAALVDQHHARGSRSLRWDLISIRLPRGIMHAKVSLLLWDNYARLIVGSANLSEDGARRNQEVFGVLDYYPQSESPLSCLYDAINFLNETANQAGESPAVSRTRDFLSLVLKRCKDWGSAEVKANEMQVAFLGLTPTRSDILTGLGDIWIRKIPPQRAIITSPFFDPPEAPNLPAQSIWNLLRPTGEVEVTYKLIGEDLPGEPAVLLHAPESLTECLPPRRRTANVRFERLTLDPTRPLHAKTIYLESDAYSLYLAGSSNFTSPGLGLGKARNIEANLIYQCPLDAGHDLPHLPSIEIPDDLEVRFIPAHTGDDDLPAELTLLPPQFSQACFGRDETGHHFVSLSFLSTPPQAFTISLEEDDKQLIFDESAWKAQGEPLTVTIEWKKARAPAGFLVSWKGCQSPAWWPVNVISPSDLPPPAELKDLPLDLLIEILTSARPAYRIIGKQLNRINARKTQAGSVIDALKRVDSYSFLLQRTRRVARALAGLRQKIEAPCTSKESLHWRLYGPIGAQALSEALLRESSSEDERYFLITELALELSRIEPSSTPDTLPASEIKEAARTFVKELRMKLPESSANLPADLSAYIKQAFHEALR